MSDLPDLFPGFETHKIEIDGLTFHARVGGSGPPLLCLHGYPQTHAHWHKVAPKLAETNTVVAMDLRGYGESAAPASDADHIAYSKRTMAADGVALMRSLGHERFTVMGHDRGGRVAYRMALDSPDAVARVILLDIIATIENWERMRAGSALKSYHWSFLAQPHPLPETLIGSHPTYYLEHTLASWTKDKTLQSIDAGALAHYRASINDPARIHAMCEDYRAGATYDWQADEASRAAGDRIKVSVHVLWASAYLTATKGRFDPLELWRGWADDVTGTEIDSGHFLAEEKPDETAVAILNFLAAHPVAA
ncbi:MAG: haloacetate dehalogenase [Hyphomicrobiaceae bacterium]|jgi:haloacetate dehalogenase